MRVRKVCILGGTGFVGRHIANRLADTSIEKRVLTRHRERNKHLLPIPNLKLTEGDVHDEKTLLRELEGCDAVINLVGVLNESRKAGEGFEDAHVKLVNKILDAARQAGVKRYLHMSSLGAGPDAPSRYQKTKAQGEAAAREAHGGDLAVTIFQPSVIFGPEDSFLNQFALMLRMAPGIFPLPTPGARFKPVYVGDVAEAFVKSLGDRDTFGQTYQLCGPRVYSLKQLVDYTAELIGTDKLVWGLSDGLSRLQARVLQLVPGKPYTYDNYLSSTVDNICTEDGLASLGISPTALEAVAPAYLGGRTPRGRYDEFRKQAHRG
ncbi:complex I NDUFA9 subunit family protein [Ectothiorhodospiraceae bacterium WFHF3C12]|nr:complex I NDUFA9 subunit family protein [Ectothiorhodospiraceae bacterium WFHF3C12]